MRKATPDRARTRARAGLCAVEDPWHAWKLRAREPGDPRATRRRHAGSHREGRRPYADDARPWEVGRAHSTREAAEQSRATGGGGRGGKGTGREEPEPAKHTPDAEPDGCAKCAGAGASGRPTRHAPEVRFDARTRGKIRMRYLRSSGSVRGAAREGGPYRGPISRGKSVTVPGTVSFVATGIGVRRDGLT